jgi:hypothetical protein
VDVYRRSNFKFFSASLRSLQFLPYPKQSRIFETLKNSKWASRAWTFQECYFSKRRLFFVGNQVIYICNRDNRRLLPTGWSPSGSRDKLSHAVNLLEAYSGRQLTYESDALAAIVSALNTLNDDTLQHMWGLPIQRLEPSSIERASYLGGELALFWRHDQPCSRRFGFPSWSPIAWTGQLSWFSMKLTNIWEVVPITHPESTTDSPWSDPCSSCAFGNIPRYLEITADMASLRIVRAPPLKGDGPCPDMADQRSFLAIPLEENLEIILNKPDWDVEPSTLPLARPIIGILSSSDTPSLPLSGPIILLVQLHGPVYKRIGILRLDFTLNYNPRLVLHNHRYLRFFCKDTAAFVYHEIDGLENMDDFEAHDIKLPFWKQSNWRNFFVRDTIVLG